jgi:hypothetical protein
MNGIDVHSAAPGRAPANRAPAERGPASGGPGDRPTARLAASDAAAGAPAVHGRPLNRRARHLAFALMSVALAFYFGFIAITVYRSHH